MTIFLYLGRLRGRANRRATFRTWELGEALHSPLTAPWHICYPPIGASSKAFARRLFLRTNFLDVRHGEVRRTPLSRTPIDNECVGSLVQNTMTSEVRFRAKLSEYGVERLELARA